MGLVSSDPGADNSFVLFSGAAWKVVAVLLAVAAVVVVRVVVAHVVV